MHTEYSPQLEETKTRPPDGPRIIGQCDLCRQAIRDGDAWRDIADEDCGVVAICGSCVSWIDLYPDQQAIRIRALEAAR